MDLNLVASCIYFFKHCSYSIHSCAAFINSFCVNLLHFVFIIRWHQIHKGWYLEQSLQLSAARASVKALSGNMTTREVSLPCGNFYLMLYRTFHGVIYVLFILMHNLGESLFISRLLCVSSTWYLYSTDHFVEKFLKHGTFGVLAAKVLLWNISNNWLCHWFGLDECLSFMQYI